MTPAGLRVGAAFARMLRAAALPCAALALALGCSTVAGDVNGVRVSIPAPAGMRAVPGGGSRTGPEITLGFFAADSTVERWRRQGGRGQLPCYASATALRTLNSNDREAKALVTERLSSPAIGSHDPAVLAAWEAALATATAGESGPLPDSPQGFVRVERVPTLSDACVELVTLHNGDHRSLNGSALVVVRSRAVSLDVVLHQPTDCREIARVRALLLAWVDAVRAANPS